MPDHALAVQAAMITAMRADATLDTLMGGTARVYDDPPDDAAEPYVWCARCDADPEDTKTTNGEMVRVEWGVDSKYHGQKEARKILDRIGELFHRQSLGLAGRDEIFMQWNGTKALIKDVTDQHFYGRIGFRVFVQGA